MSTTAPASCDVDALPDMSHRSASARVLLHSVATAPNSLRPIGPRQRAALSRSGILATCVAGPPRRPPFCQRRVVSKSSPPSCDSARDELGQKGLNAVCAEKLVEPESQWRRNPALSVGETSWLRYACMAGARLRPPQCPRRHVVLQFRAATSSESAPAAAHGQGQLHCTSRPYHRKAPNRCELTPTMVRQMAPRVYRSTSERHVAAE